MSRVVHEVWTEGETIVQFNGLGPCVIQTAPGISWGLLEYSACSGPRQATLTDNCVNPAPEKNNPPEGFPRRVLSAVLTAAST